MKLRQMMQEVAVHILCISVLCSPWLLPNSLHIMKAKRGPKICKKDIGPDPLYAFVAEVGGSCSLTVYVLLISSLSLPPLTAGAKIKV